MYRIGLTKNGERFWVTDVDEADQKGVDRYQRVNEDCSKRMKAGLSFNAAYRAAVYKECKVDLGDGDFRV